MVVVPLRRMRCSLYEHYHHEHIPILVSGLHRLCRGAGRLLPQALSVGAVRARRATRLRRLRVLPLLPPRRQQPFRQLPIGEKMIPHKMRNKYMYLQFNLMIILVRFLFDSLLQFLF